MLCCGKAAWNSTQSEVTPIHASNVGKSFLHHEMKGSVEKLSNNSTKCGVISRRSIDETGHP